MKHVLFAFLVSELIVLELATISAAFLLIRIFQQASSTEEMKEAFWIVIGKRNTRNQEEQERKEFVWAITYLLLFQAIVMPIIVFGCLVYV